MKFKSKSESGNMIMISAFMLLALSVVGLGFLIRSNQHLSFSQGNLDSVHSKELMMTTMAESDNFMRTAIESVQLDGRIQYSGGPATEDFASMAAAYVGAELDSAESATLALEFLTDAVEAQAYSAGGVIDASHPYASFAAAFPSAFTDPNPSDDEYVEVRYTFTPLPTEMNAGTAMLRYTYDYQIDVRAYGPNDFVENSSSTSGRFEITLQGAPFSKWATIVNALVNQNGSTLVFAGGDTAAQIQSVYDGPVHINERGNFYGSPVFNDEFTTHVAESTWQQYTATNYSCCAVFNGAKRGGAEEVSFPTELNNTIRLAAGDTSATAATNTSAIAEADIIDLIEHHAYGDIPGGTVVIPNGIYVSVDSSGSSSSTGGIYVEGDANISLNVVQGSGDFDATAWSNVNAAHQSCKFQKVKVDHADASVNTREMYIGSDCEVTYIFNGDNYAEAPVVLNNRLNGNIFVDGNIDELGGESRTRPAIAQDFGFHITAQKDVRIKNDIQYEDAQYVTMTSDGTKGGTVVADPTGEVGGSGIQPTDADLAATIDSNSSTILGISSLKRNVKIHIDAPSNMNLHASIYAGNSDPYDAATGYGCNANTASKRGCGFGVEGWDTKTGAGVLKLLGGVAQYKSQTSGRLSNPPTGYASRYVYDTRLRQDIQPPAFPVSNDFDAYPVFYDMKMFQLVSSY